MLQFLNRELFCLSIQFASIDASQVAKKEQEQVSGSRVKQALQHKVHTLTAVAGDNEPKRFTSVLRNNKCKLIKVLTNS